MILAICSRPSVPSDSTLARLSSELIKWVCDLRHIFASPIIPSSGSNRVKSNRFAIKTADRVVWSDQVEHCREDESEAGRIDPVGEVCLARG